MKKKYSNEKVIRYVSVSVDEQQKKSGYRYTPNLEKF